MRALLALVLLAGCVSPAAVPDPVALLPDAPSDLRLSPEGVRASEVTVVADPRDPARLVAGANSQGGIGVYRTTDAGANWTADRFGPERVDPLPNGEARFQRLGDPALAWGPDGTLWLAGLAVLPTSGIFVAASRDGGATWEDARVVDESDPLTEFNDKEWIGVHPATGTLLVAWQKEPAMDSFRDVEFLTGLDVDVGHVVVARSADGGRTWSEPLRVSRGEHNNGTQVAFTADGRAHLLWVNYETGTLDHVVSEDDGVTWSAPRAVADVHVPPPFERYPRMHTLPALVAHEDALAAVWHDLRNGDLDVYAATSLDAGRTWSAPSRVNDDALGNGAVQFYPWAAFGPDGRLHVSFYDAREDPDTPRFRFALATAPAAGAPFGATRAVGAEAFTAFATEGLAPGEPDPARRTLGDYTGLAATALGVFPVWTDGREAVESVYATRVAP